jgi:hypothetical protein
MSARYSMSRLLSGFDMTLVKAAPKAHSQKEVPERSLWGGWDSSLLLGNQ